MPIGLFATIIAVVSIVLLLPSGLIILANTFCTNPTKAKKILGLVFGFLFLLLSAIGIALIAASEGV